MNGKAAGWNREKRLSTWEPRARKGQGRTGLEVTVKMVDYLGAPV